ncbi:hypothetical protein GC102_32390 [Paenibacillus sp. LMG 31460]|uniref:SLH domain-containing protein n=2 Tax=Paenibacillus germinis TaxID=2654979 RepID=A0ABX1ZC09_9BACL|nr:hypothetical protein [Paenibacillus germinis]
MKKSLSVILSTAMALSMFSSVAFGKTSADFTDLKDLDAATKAKFDALISAGIFEGTTDTTFGLKEEMNRAQFAKVAALITSLEINKDLKTSSFSDVKSDDAANGYALPYIEALKTAGVTDGYGEGTYNPAGKVTKEQLATFLVRVLGKDAEAKAKTGTDTTVSGWAQGYVALALELKLLPAGADGKFGGQANATRDLLLTGAYEAKAQYVSPGKVSVTAAKATGAKKVEVTLNKPVDKDKAKFELKKGSVVVAVDAVVDNKTATLTLKDTKLTDGTYTVTLSGLDAATVDKTTAEFKAENEKVTKIDFANASDTVAQSANVRVKVKATNQYGENASFSSGAYTVYSDASSNAQLLKTASGELLLKLNTSGYTAGTGLVPVNIYDNENHVSVSKTFKVGTAPFISKMEISEIKYSNGKDSIGTKGETATFDLTNYDQYGNVVAFVGGTGTNSDVTNTRVVFNGYEPALDYEVADSNSDDIADVKIFLKNNIDKTAEISFTVYNQAGSGTGKVKLAAGKVATKVEVGDISTQVAAGDTEFYVPITAYDAAGNVLSVDDLVSNQNVGRIKISSSTDGTVDYSVLQTSGEHRGQVKVSNLPTTSKSIVSVTAYIAEPNASSNDTATFTVGDVRVPESFKVVTDPAKKIAEGAESAFEIHVYDQYGKKLENLKSTDGNGNLGTAVKYQVAVSTAVYGGVTVTAPSTTYTGPAVATFDNEYKFVYGTASTTTANSGQITVSIQKQIGTGAWNDITSPLTKKIEAVTGDLTYSINNVDKLVNAIDTSSVSDYVYDTNTTVDILTVAQQEAPLTSKFDKQVKITATDSAGNTVAIPQTIQALYSSNPVVAKTDIDTATGKGYVIGNKKGTATLNVSFLNNKNETVQKTVNVSVQDDVLTSTAVVAGNTTRSAADWTAAVTAATNGTEGTDTKPNAFRLMNLKVTDNYGVTFEGFDAQKYNYLFGVVFTVKAIAVDSGTVGSDAAHNVTVDKFGNITAGANVDGFDIIATTATGLSATTSVTLP